MFKNHCHQQYLSLSQVYPHLGHHGTETRGKVSEKNTKNTHNSQQHGAIHFRNHPCQLVRGNGFTLLTSKRVSKKAFAIMKSWKGAKVPEGNRRNAK